MFVDPAPTILEGANTGMLGGIDQYSDVRDSLSRLGIKVVKRGMQSDNFVLGTTGWKLDADGTIYGYNAVFAGGTIGGFSIGADYIRDAANSFGLASTVTVGDDVRFWAGATYANRATAPARITEAGIIYATGAVIDGTTTIGGRLASVLASAIDSVGHFIDANLDTSAKTILKDFTFSPSDYAGAFKTGDITWNTTTGAITGGSGGLFNKNGLVFAVAGVATITLDGTTGSATFAGTLSAASGTLGAITIGSNAWHVDSSGNIWWGTSATYAGATIKISSAGSVDLTTGTFSGSLTAVTGTLGALTIASGGNIKLGQTAYATGTGFWMGDVTGTTKFSIGSATNYFTFDGVNADANSFRYLETYTAGENITAGNVVCIKPSTTITDIATQDSWAEQANPASTHGSDVNFYVGVSGGQQCYGYVEFDETAFPNPQDILKAELILTTAGNQPAGGGLTVFTIDAAWDEATLCWNNKPAVTDQVQDWGDAGGIGNVPTAPNTQYVIEITQIARRWKNADLTFYGFFLSSGHTTPCCFHSSESATVAYRPFIRITNLSVSDGKVYKADFSDYKLCRFIAGIAIETKSAAESVRVQISGKNSNQSGLTIGKIAYLGNTGGLTTELNNVTNIVQIGQVISATTVHIDIGYSPLLIEHNTVPLTELELIVPEDAKSVVINNATEANVVCYRGLDSLGATWSLDGSVPKVTIGYNQYYFYR